MGFPPKAIAVLHGPARSAAGASSRRCWQRCHHTRGFACVEIGCWKQVNPAAVLRLIWLKCELNA
jgi:hypothetical protein